MNRVRPTQLPRVVRLAGAIVAGLAATTLPVDAAHAADPVRSCPTSPVTSSLTLGADLPGCTLAVRAGGVTIDLGQHLVGGVEISGLPTGAGTVTVRNGSIDPRTIDPQFPGDGVSSTGASLRLADLAVSGAATGITVVDGTARLESVTVSASGVGVALSGVRQSTVFTSTFHDNSAGLLLSFATSVAVAGSQFRDNELFGVRLDRTSDSVLAGNQLAGNGVGLDTAAAGNARVTITGNLVSANRGRGLELVGPQRGLAIEYNLARGNGTATAPGPSGDAGIHVDVTPLDGAPVAATLKGNAAIDNAGLGISASGAVDGGQNIASGNGDPAQCTGVAC